MTTPLASLKNDLRRETEIVQTIDDVIHNNEELGRRIFRALQKHFAEGSNETLFPKPRGRPRASGARLEPIVNALDGKGWVTTPALAKTVGLAKTQIKRVMSEHPERFESRVDPDNARRSQWRLREAA